MPKQLTKNVYICSLCDEVGIKKEFADEEMAKHHEIYDHDRIYLPIERKDLNGLLNFMVGCQNNQSLLSERLYNTIMKFSRIDR